MKPSAAPAVGAALMACLAYLGWLRAPISRSPVSARVRELEAILRSKNDNDPRLDTSFEGLSADEKRLFRAVYERLPRERRNERGTIVYLLGRNLSSPEDWAFYQAVVAEPPCLSLADCSRAATGGDGDEVTLAYPALVALRQARRAADQTQAAKVVAKARLSRVPAVVRASK